MLQKENADRTCPNCKKTKAPDEFRRRKGATAEKENRVGQVYGWCKACESLRRGKSVIAYWQKGIFNIRKRAESKYVEFDLTAKKLEEMCTRQGMKCALSGRDLTFTAGKGRVHTNASVDRIETRGPYTMDNIRIVCDFANVMRGDAKDDDFLIWCEDVLNSLGRQNKIKKP